MANHRLLALTLFDPTHNACTHTHVHPHCTHGTCGVLDCLLFCDQTRPNLRISLVGYHCSIEFPCGVPLFYCCKYPTTYGVRVHKCLARIFGTLWRPRTTEKTKNKRSPQGNSKDCGSPQGIVCTKSIGLS